MAESSVKKIWAEEKRDINDWFWRGNGKQNRHVSRGGRRVISYNVIHSDGFGDTGGTSEVEIYKHYIIMVRRIDYLDVGSKYYRWDYFWNQAIGGPINAPNPEYVDVKVAFQLARKFLEDRVIHRWIWDQRDKYFNS